MHIFKRTIDNEIRRSLFQGRMISILGPRQSGKTTLSKSILSTYEKEGEYFNCELDEIRRNFQKGKPDLLKVMIGDKRIVVFDEAQTIQDIGSVLKVFHDTYPDIQVIATGSSSFDLSNKINEPMTGRVFEFTLFPLSLEELRMGRDMAMAELYNLFLYGSYPAVVAASGIESKKQILKNIATQYLYKDVFVFEAIRNPKVFEDLLRLLALHIGSLVSVNELAESLGVSHSVIRRYLRLLEQSFIIKAVHSFSNNPRTELKKAFKVYFLDTGVRNALMDIEKPMDERSDRGFIFENFFVMEKMKEGNNTSIFPPEIMFWRTRQGLEIDLIEKKGERINAYECKWNPDETCGFSTFLKYYPDAKVKVIHPNDLADGSHNQDTHYQLSQP